MLGKYPRTKHGTKRTRKRMGIPPKSLRRMAQKALREGRYPDELPTPVRVWLESKVEPPAMASVYGEFCYIFNGTTLLTTFRVPAEFLKYLKGH